MKHILELIEEEDTDDAVWVIAGRNNIPIKNQRHENIVVGNFSETDAAYYLQEKRGVKEQEVIDKIFKLSDGSPIFLQIGADTYNNMSEEERVNASDAVYGIDREELIKRYMKYLNERDKDLLYMMSSMMHWGKEDFKFVCNKVYNNNWSQYEGNYNKIIETPMIEKLEGKERRFLHRVVRNSIYTDPQYPEENRANTWDAIVELYRQRITEEPMELIYYKNRLIEILTRAVEINETMTEEQEDAVLSIISNSAYDLKSYGYNNIDEYVVALEEYMAIEDISFCFLCEAGGKVGALALARMLGLALANPEDRVDEVLRQRVKSLERLGVTLDLKDEPLLLEMDTFSNDDKPARQGNYSVMCHLYGNYFERIFDIDGFESKNVAEEWAGFYFDTLESLGIEFEIIKGNILKND